jgi:hypothetical protein
MTRKKPNYTQFMKRPAPLEFSPPSNTEDPPSRIGGGREKEKVSELEIPWGEIIVEFGPNDSVSLGLVSKAAGSPIATEPPSPAAHPAPPALQGGEPKPPTAAHADIEGTAVVAEPDPTGTRVRASDVAEWTFPGPGAPPLVFMAIAVVLLLCLL